MTLDLIVNGVVAMLLVVTIGVATLLYVRLGRIRKTRSEMEALIAQLGAAGAAAENSLRGFRELADGAGRDLEQQVRSGVSLREELAFLIDRASAIADRLANAPVASAAPAQSAQPVPSPAGQAQRAAKLVQAIRPRGRPAEGAARPARVGVAPDAAIAHRADEAEQALMRALESAR
ncbi:MAG: DUF6468 domain-containing protein [Alphaproteobacteria bacterium]